MKISRFVDEWTKLTNGDVFDFVKTYGETKFFLDLWTYLIGRGDGWKESYAEITHTYYKIRSYFELH